MVEDEKDTIDVALIFEIKKLNDDLEELIPIKVVEGIHDDKSNTFKDKDNVIYEHITKAEVGTCGYGIRLTLDVRGNVDESEIEPSKIPELEKIKKTALEKAKDHMFNYQKTFRYYRYPGNKERVFIQEPGEAMMILDDDDSPKKDTKVKMRKAKDIVKEVTKSVKGQDAAVKKIVTSLCIAKKRPEMTKRNMLVVGPTGVGKTMIFQKLQEILGIPLTIFPIPGISQAGYQGGNVDDILKEIYYNCGCDEELAEESIVILDEIDKLAGRGEGSVSTTGVQNELLKIIEGTVKTVELNPATGESFTIDTSNIIFVGTGAFSEVFEEAEAQSKKIKLGFTSGEEKKDTKKEKLSTKEKIKRYGLKKELVGRLPVFVELDAMTKIIMIDLIKNSEDSELKRVVTSLYNRDGIIIENLDELIEIIADDAISQGVGARGLIDTISNAFDDIFYTLDNEPGKYEKIIIGKNILNDNTDYVLVPKQVKKRVKKASFKGTVRA